MFNSIVVTGGGGTVGKYIVEYLLKEDDIKKVIVNDLPNVDLKEFENNPKVTVKKGDLTNREFVKELVKDAECIIHSAATLNTTLPYEEVAKINVNTVSSLLEEGKNNNLKFFLLFSSASIYKPTGKPLKEDSLIEPYSTYEQSKIDAEHILKKFVKDNPNINWSIIRPSLIYGPRAKFLAGPLVTIPPLFYFVTGGRMIGFKGGVKANWVHAEDVARAVVFIIKNKDTWNEIYNIADDTPLSFGEILTASIEAYGFKPKQFITLPSTKYMQIVKPFLDNDYFFAILNNSGKLLWDYIIKVYNLEKGITPHLNRSALNYSTHDIIFDNSKLKKKGFSYKWRSLKDGYRDVLKWYQERRYVPTYEELISTTRFAFSFREKMSGSITAKDNSFKDTEIRFSLLAKTKRFEGVFGDIDTEITGDITIGEFIEDAKLNGTLFISLFKDRKIIYNFRFKDKEGNDYKFYGIKKLSLLNFIKSITQMDVILEKNGNLWALGEMKFDLKHDLIPFFRSFIQQ